MTRQARAAATWQHPAARAQPGYPGPTGVRPGQQPGGCVHRRCIPDRRRGPRGLQLHHLRYARDESAPLKTAHTHTNRSRTCPCTAAYGQTGTGKTYTMEGIHDTGCDLTEHAGVIPRCIKQVGGGRLPACLPTLPRLPAWSAYLPPAITRKRGRREHVGGASKQATPTTGALVMGPPLCSRRAGV